MPYVVLLMHAMTSYKAAHGGAPPKAYKEKEAFKEGVKAMARPGVDELNVAEAVANAYRVYGASASPKSQRFPPWHPRRSLRRSGAREGGAPPAPSEAEPSGPRVAALRALQGRFKALLTVGVLSCSAQGDGRRAR